MKYIFSLVLALFLGFLTKASILSKDYSTIIKITVGDCVTCTKAIHEPAAFLQYTESVIVMLPKKYKNDSAKMRILYPELSNNLYKVIYTDTIYQGMESNTTSYIYLYLDNKCIKKIPLKYFVPATFYGDVKPNIVEEKPTNTTLTTNSINSNKEKNIIKIDTITTTNTSPQEFYQAFVTSNGTYYVIDMLDNSLVYKPADKQEWLSIDGNILRRMVMKRLIPTMDADTVIALQDKIFKEIKIYEGKKSEAIFIAEKSDTVFALFCFPFVNGDCIENYSFIFSIYDNNIINAIYVNDSAYNLLKKISKETGHNSEIKTNEQFLRHKKYMDSLNFEFKQLHSIFPNALFVKNSSQFYIPNSSLVLIETYNPNGSDSFIAVHNFRKKMYWATDNFSKLHVQEFFRKTSLKITWQLWLVDIHLSCSK